MPHFGFGDWKRTSAERAAAFVLCASWLLAMSGCGSASHELETSPVNGRVTLDGQPLPSGYVFVLPERGRMAKGAIQSNGTFTLGTYRSDDGAQVGRHGVIVTEVPGDERTAAGAREKVRVSVPRRYANASTSGLVVDVQPGQRNEVELQLTNVGN
jgi:hypothetical protein